MNTLTKELQMLRNAVTMAAVDLHSLQLHTELANHDRDVMLNFLSDITEVLVSQLERAADKKAR